MKLTRSLLSPWSVYLIDSFARKMSDAFIIRLNVLVDQRVGIAVAKSIAPVQRVIVDKDESRF